eukprot:14341463-Alexandrium_andersonii.AAC.1
MCQFGMCVPVPASASGGGRLVRKRARWASSSPEVLERVCLRCSNEGFPLGDARLHDRAVLQAWGSGGVDLTA